MARDLNYDINIGAKATGHRDIDKTTEKIDKTTKALKDLERQARRSRRELEKAGGGGGVGAGAGAKTGGLGAWKSGFSSLKNSLSGPIGWIKQAAKAVTGVFRTVWRTGTGALRAVGGLLSWVGGLAKTVFGTLAKLAGTAFGILKKVALVGVGLFAGFIYGGIRAISTFAEFEQSLRNAMTVTGLFGQELLEAETSMGRFARYIAAQSTKTATDVAQAFYSLASAGLTVREIMESATGTIALAEATQADMGTATELVTSQLKAFGLQAGETNRLVNTMAASISKSPLNIMRLAYSLQYVAPVARQLGLEFEDVVAALGLLAKAGLYGEMAGSGLRNVIIKAMQGGAGNAEPGADNTLSLRKLGRLKRDYQELHSDWIRERDIEKQERLGKRLRSLMERISDANYALQKRNRPTSPGERPLDLEGGMAGLISGAMAKGPEALMGQFGIRAGPAIMALASQGVTAFRDLREEITGTNMAFSLQQQQLQTIAGQWKILKSGIEESKHQFGEAAKPGTRSFIESLIQLTTRLRDAGVFKALGTAFGVLARVVGQLFGAVTKEGAASLATRIVEWAKKIPGYVQKAWNGLQRLWAWIKQAGGAVLEWIRDHWQGFKESAKTAFWTAIYYAQWLWDWLSNKLPGGWAQFKAAAAGALEYVGQKLWDIGSWMFEKLPGYIGGAVDAFFWLGRTVVGVIATIQVGWYNFVEGMKPAVLAMVNAIEPILKAAAKVPGAATGVALSPAFGAGQSAQAARDRGRQTHMQSGLFGGGRRGPSTFNAPGRQGGGVPSGFDMIRNWASRPGTPPDLTWARNFNMWANEWQPKTRDYLQGMAQQGGMAMGRAGQYTWGAGQMIRPQGQRTGFAGSPMGQGMGYNVQVNIQVSDIRQIGPAVQRAVAQHENTQRRASITQGYAN